MSSAERNHEKHPKGQLPEGVFHELIDRTGQLVVAADKRGVQLSVAYQNGYMFSQDPRSIVPVEIGYTKERFAASHAKLAVGAYALRRIQDEFDERWTLMDLMLRESDNSAMRELVTDDPREINDETRRLAGVTGDALTVRPDGSYYAGQTSAPDSLRSFVHLLRTASRTGNRNRVSAMLGENTSVYGVRQSIGKMPVVNLLNKTGDYYGHDDDEVGEAVHHDVGVIYTRHNGKSSRVLYGITTSAESTAGARRADGFVRSVGGELVKALGGTRVRALGTRALTLTPGK